MPISLLRAARDRSVTRPPSGPAALLPGENLSGDFAPQGADDPPPAKGGDLGRRHGRSAQGKAASRNFP
jgi:hypothetical protein